MTMEVRTEAYRNTRTFERMSGSRETWVRKGEAGLTEES